MATNRYGQIYHGDYHHINIRFPSTEARLKFQNEFEAYHQGHDHEGDIPTFISVSSKDLKLSTGSRSPQDLVKAETDENYRITIDGYSWNEIHEYHNPTGWKILFGIVSQRAAFRPLSSLTTNSSILAHSNGMNSRLSLGICRNRTTNRYSKASSATAS